MAKKETKLYETVHWREIRKITSKIAKMEHLDLSMYNTQNIRCYSCIGNDLQGRNVTYCTNEDRSCFVGDNKYSVFEIPSIKNQDRSNFCGKYIVLAHNISFDYWLFSTMIYNVDWSSTAKNSTIQDNVTYCPYGEYTVTLSNDDCFVSKKQDGKYCNKGESPYKMSDFRYDRVGARKTAYNMTDSKIIAKAQGKTLKKAEGGSKVKIYKKNSRGKKY